MPGAQHSLKVEGGNIVSSLRDWLLHINIPLRYIELFKLIRLELIGLISLNYVGKVMVV